MTPTARGLLIGVACWSGIASLGTELRAQGTVGTVSLKDASVTGSLKVSGGQAEMQGSTTVTAGEHTAEMRLARGGTVEVCATSALHVTSGNLGGNLGGKVEAGQPSIATPLLLALDRGAVEVHMRAGTKDAIMTPDLRFGIGSAGPLDLRIRVTNNGDTCVESRGQGAPALEIRDQFGESSYQLRAGQHVLFEHGSLKEVVDHESSPCGCPAAAPAVSIADVGTTSAATPASPGARVAATAAEHPFPAAESQGLAPSSASAGAAVPQAPAGVVHAQVAATMAYDAGAGGGDVPASASNAGGSGGSSLPPATSAAPAAGVPPAASGDPVATSPAPTAAGATAQAPAPQAPPSAGDLGHRIGRFFKRIFGRG